MKKYLFLLILLCGVLLPTSYYGASEDLLIKIGPTIKNGQEVQMTSDGALYNDWTDLSNSVRLTNDYGQIKVNGQTISQISTQGSFIGYKDNKYRGDFVF
ncbi:conserved domain protein [Peptoniphilus sp. oral taxon 375 str. F0436]|nr:conserved domain protein [Peptoniphilus sp. oral taxon 375 str. F0436]